MPLLASSPLSLLSTTTRTKNTTATLSPASVSPLASLLHVVVVFAVAVAVAAAHYLIVVFFFVVDVVRHCIVSLSVTSPSPPPTLKVDCCFFQGSTAQAFVVLPVCSDGSVVVVIVAIVSLSSASPLPAPPTLPRQQRHHTPSNERWGKGHARGRGLPTRLDDGEGHFLSGVEKKVKYQVWLSW